jgi:hypothetical protein
MATWDDGPGRLPDPDAPGLIPDDASALEPDRLAWLAEQGALPPLSSPTSPVSPATSSVSPAIPQPSWQQQSRQQSRQQPPRPGLAHRMIFTRRWRRFGLSGPIVILCLLAAGLVGVVAVTLITRPGPPAPSATTLSRAPIARVTRPSDASPPATVEHDGGPVIGHRLPGVPLAGDARPTSSEALRPAVIVMVPAVGEASSRQRYAGVVHQIYQQAREFRLEVWLIADGGSAEADASRSYLAHLDEAATSGGARWALDPGGALASALAVEGPALIAVRADGVVTGMRRDLPLDPAALPALEPLFARLAIVNR